MKFTKMHGCGNDYVYVNCFDEKFPECPEKRAKWVRKLSDRHFGIGGDGVIFICPSDVADAQMRMFNADGSESEMCGNGVRCVAKYVYDHGIVQNKDEIAVDTLAGVKFIQVVEKNLDGTAAKLRVDMGEPILELEKIPTTLKNGINEPLQVVNSGEKIFPHEEEKNVEEKNVSSHKNVREFHVTTVSMGNPHCVTFVDEITDRMVFGFGPLMENHEVFPARANIEFIQVISRTELKMRVWERGTGETYACGTGASAVCVAGVLTGNTERKVLIHLLGGDLELEWDENNNHVYMTGPAVEVFRGEI
ncbi:MAG: diaminopimelate epimerase [Planctomycetia bacterium]|nr:diaminopimelate epimerase [Planctomycetia bacterium]